MFRRALSLAFVFGALFVGRLDSFSASKPDAVTIRAMGILKSSCLSCHSDEKHKGSLRLTSKANALKGGENGPVIVAGKPEESLLAKAILIDADPHMPPKKQLSNGDIESLKHWISSGANWDEKTLLAISEEKPVRFVPLPSGYQPVLCLALSPDEKLIAIGRANHIYLHDLTQTNHPITQDLQGHQDLVQSLAWSSDGKSLASGAFRKIIVWKIDHPHEKREFTNGLTGRITSVQFSTNSETLLAADGVPTKSGLIHFISLATGKNETINAHGDTIYALRINHQGTMFATAGADKLAKLWDFTTRKQIAKYEAHMGYVLSLAFNLDGSSLATGGADKVLNIWDVKTGKQDITVNKHPAPVSDLAWTDDGKKLYSACEDGTVRLFTNFKTHSGAESSDGAQERNIGKTDDMLYSITATADGKKVFAGSHDGTVYCWNSDGKLIEKFTPKSSANTNALAVSR
jgi:WD40 repeat protein